jgi:hypothetical protein
MKSFASRRCKSSITHRFEKPVRLASTCNSIWRLAATVDSALGAGINWINTRYRVASARRYGAQKELKVGLRHALSTFSDLNGSGS